MQTLSWLDSNGERCYFVDIRLRMLYGHLDPKQATPLTLEQVDTFKDQIHELFDHPSHPRIFQTETL